MVKGIVMTKKGGRIMAEFKPIHLFNHSTNESFQIVTREGLIAWLNDYANVENHSAFNSYEELAKVCLEKEDE